MISRAGWRVARIRLAVLKSFEEKTENVNPGAGEGCRIRGSGVNISRRRSSDRRRLPEDALWEGGEREGAGGDAPEDGGTGAKMPEEAQNLPNIKDQRLGWCRRAKLGSLSYNKCSVAALFTFQEKCSLRCVFLEFSC